MQGRVRFQSPPHSAVALVEDEDECPDVPLGVLRCKKPRGLPKCTKLKIPVLVTWGDGTSQNMEALVDTGAEVNLVNPKLINSQLFTPSSRPVRLGVANSHLLQGGSREVNMDITFTAIQFDTAKQVAVVLPCTAYDGEVTCDLILSYGWLAEHHILVNPRRHGLMLPDVLWVKGLVKPKNKMTQVLQSVPIDVLQLVRPVVTSSSSSKHSTEDVECQQICAALEEREALTTVADYLKTLQLAPQPVHPGMGCPDMPGLCEDNHVEHLQDEDLECVAQELIKEKVDVNYIRGFVQSRDEVQGASVEELRKSIIQEYASTVFCGKTTGSPPKRGEYGEAEIILKPGAVPVKQRPYQMTGERRVAWMKLTDLLIEDGKLEPGSGPWLSPSFPVPKKKPGTWRLVVDFRRLNEATVVDSHPLPRIGDILQRQGQFKIWSVLDMKDGYHQVPLKKEHRNLTCMATPRGTMRWRVLVMGLKNGNAIFQRVMEDVLKDLDHADPYVDDVIIGSTGETEAELIHNHERDLRKVLKVLEAAGLVADPGKAQLFVREVEFCGHLLRDGQRYPSPGKLLPIQKWELPPTLTKLRGFLGLCNYYEEYVPGYAEIAWRIMEKLKVRGPDAKAGSNLKLEWTPEEMEAFHALKKALSQALSLYQVVPDEPFQMRTDASNTALGAVLQQKRDTWVPVCFFSRKLTSSQLNWSPREKEAYAVVASLIKWAGWIGTTPVEVVTDHKSLESWVKEYVQTPSGPTGRKARWHEIFSQFQLSITYQPGSTNIVADAMTRYAYPASLERHDVCAHGTAGCARAMHEMECWEGTEGRRLDGWDSMVSAVHKRKSRENYRLLPHIRDQALWDIGVLKEWVQADLFACKQNATHPVYIDKRRDAFTYSWDRLLSDPQHVLWANPPFSMMEQVVTKIILEPTRVVLVTPEWRDYPWWKPLDFITVARTYIPASQAIYKGDCQRQTLPAPGWRTVVSLVDSKKWHTTLVREDMAHWVKSQCQGKDMDVLKSELQTPRDVQVHVHTRSGLDTVDVDEEEEESLGVEEMKEEEIPGDWDEEIDTQDVHTPRREPVGDSTVGPPVTFKFWHQMSPEEQAERRSKRSWGGRGGRRASPSPDASLPVLPPEDKSPVMDQCWDDAYEYSDLLGDWWRATKNSGSPWPGGVQLHYGKMYWQGRLCVPESVALRVLWDFHSAAGHIGINRMLRELHLRYAIPDTVPVQTVVKAIRKGCPVCQAAEPPHFAREGIQEPFPVPERLMHSVCLDVFSMVPTNWQGEDYDCILLCVDRLSGWMVACPTTKLGLSSSRAAHLLLEKGWEPFAVPATVHSDCGSQFIGDWWKTMCSRLGIHHTYSQPHRPRANGRAERAGQQLLSILKKLHLEHGINWVESLPRALRIHHDTIGESGYSPYEIVFGRTRMVPGIPYTPDRVCEDASDFMSRMEHVDQMVAQRMHEVHLQSSALVNKRKVEREAYLVGSLVWLLKAPSHSSQAKLEARWRGPLQVVERTGERSYVVGDAHGGKTAAHIDQLKPYTPLGEVGELAGLDLPPPKLVERIMNHRGTTPSQWEFLVWWRGEPAAEAAWVSRATLWEMGFREEIQAYLGALGMS